MIPQQAISLSKGGLVIVTIAMSGTPASSVVEGVRLKSRGKLGKRASLGLDFLDAVPPEHAVEAAQSSYKLPGLFLRLTRLTKEVG